jgi:hypothetical protein
MKHQPAGNGFSAASSPRNLGPSCVRPRLQPGKCAETGDLDGQDHQGAVHQQTTVLGLMPLNSTSKVTVGERYQIERWFETGATVKRVPLGPRRGLSFQFHSPAKANRRFP